MIPNAKTIQKNKLSEAPFILILCILFILTPEGSQSHHLLTHLSLMFLLCNISVHMYATHHMHFFACYIFPREIISLYQ